MHDDASLHTEKDSKNKSTENYCWTYRKSWTIKEQVHKKKKKKETRDIKFYAKQERKH